MGGGVLYILHLLAGPAHIFTCSLMGIFRSEWTGLVLHRWLLRLRGSLLKGGIKSRSLTSAKTGGKRKQTPDLTPPPRPPLRLGCALIHVRPQSVNVAVAPLLLLQLNCQFSPLKMKENEY